MMIDYKMMQDSQLIDNLLAKQLLDMLDEMYAEKGDVFLLQHWFFVFLKDFHDQVQWLLTFQSIDKQQTQNLLHQLEILYYQYEQEEDYHKVEIIHESKY